MLTELIVEGLGVIDRAEITPGPGCNALTGETGAGKTLIVAGLGLLLGDRMERSMIRAGRDSASVQARFEVARSSMPASSLEQTLEGLVDAEGVVDIVLTRTVAADGRSRARINDRLVTVAALAGIAGTLLEIAGQHSHYRLARKERQRAALDAFIGPKAIAAAAEVARAVRAANETRRALEELESGDRKREREVDVLRFEIAEIESASIDEGEEERLRAEAERLELVMESAGAIAEALDALGAERGAMDQLDRAAAALNKISGAGTRGASVAERLNAVVAEVGDIAGELAVGREDPPPGLMDEVRERLSAVSRLNRKYADEGGALAYLDRARTRLQAIEGSEEDIVRLRDEFGAADARARERAEELSEMRRGAAPEWSRALADVLAKLALPQARVETKIRMGELTEGGLESVELMLATNPGEELKPVNKVASGGELARLALAVHVVSKEGDVPTVVFDEIDAGVGGAAAQSIGRLLAELARDAGQQVIVVTHLPQVAAWADAHWRVDKVVDAGHTAARVARVEGPERVAELGRMLAGLPESDSARDHAEELLTLAAREK